MQSGSSRPHSQLILILRFLLIISSSVRYFRKQTAKILGRMSLLWSSTKDCLVRMKRPWFPLLGVWEGRKRRESDLHSESDYLWQVPSQEIVVRIFHFLLPFMTESDELENSRSAGRSLFILAVRLKDKKNKKMATHDHRLRDVSQHSCFIGRVKGRCYQRAISSFR